MRFISKPTADTILKVDEKDPLLVRWQYGLGRAVVFTSDAKSRWAADWVTWKGFDKLWTNTFRDLLPHAESGEAKAEYDSASGDLVVNYHLGADAEDPAKLPEHLRARSQRLPSSGADHETRPRNRIAGPFTSAICRDCSASGRWMNRALFPRSVSISPSKNCWTTDRTNSCCARLRNSPAAASIRRPSRCSIRAADPSHLRCGCGRCCWAWRSR